MNMVIFTNHKHVCSQAFLLLMRFINSLFREILHILSYYYYRSLIFIKSKQMMMFRKNCRF